MSLTSTLFVFLFFALVSCDAKTNAKTSNPHQLQREIKAKPKSEKNDHCVNNPIHIEDGRWNSIRADFRILPVWANPKELTRIRTTQENYGIHFQKKRGSVVYSELHAADGRVLLVDISKMKIETFRKRFQNTDHLGVLLTHREIKNPDFLKALREIKHLGIAVYGRHPEEYLSLLATIPSIEMLVIVGEVDLINLKILSKMHQLQSLILIGSNIRNENLELLTELSNLYEIGLYNTKLTHLEALTKFPRLASFRFFDKFVKIDALKNMTNLKSIRGSMTEDQLKVISGMSQLRRLEFEPESEITNQNLEMLKEMQKLQYLDLSGTKITNIENLKNLKGLRTLLLDSAKISDITPLGNLKNLENLSLRRVRTKSIDILRENNNLKYLSLSSIRPKNYEVLSKLKKLEYLDLTSSGIQDLSVLKDSVKLRTLQLKFAPFLKEESLEVLQHLKNLEIRGTDTFDDPVISKEIPPQPTK